MTEPGPVTFQFPSQLLQWPFWISQAVPSVLAILAGTMAGVEQVVPHFMALPISLFPQIVLGDGVKRWVSYLWLSSGIVHDYILGLFCAVLLPFDVFICKFYGCLACTFGLTASPNLSCMQSWNSLPRVLSQQLDVKGATSSSFCLISTLSLAMDLIVYHCTMLLSEAEGWEHFVYIQ